MPPCPSGPGAGGSRGGLSRPRQRCRPERPEYGGEDAAPILSVRGAARAVAVVDLYEEDSSMFPLTVQEERTRTSTPMHFGPVFNLHAEKYLRTTDPEKVNRSGRWCLGSAQELAKFDDANMKKYWRQAMQEELRSIHDNNA